MIEHEEIRAIMEQERVKPEAGVEGPDREPERSPAGDRAAALVSKPPEPKQG